MIQLRTADEFCAAVKQHSFGWLLGCHWPFDHGVHVVVFGFGLKRKKAGSVVPPALLLAGCLVVVVLVSLPILQILLAAFTPPERASGIRGTLFHDVEVGALQHLRPGCDITAVTAGKPHRVIYSTASKDGRHRGLLSATQPLRSSSHRTECSGLDLQRDSTIGWNPQAVRTPCRT